MDGDLKHQRFQMLVDFFEGITLTDPPGVKNGLNHAGRVTKLSFARIRVALKSLASQAQSQTVA